MIDPLWAGIAGAVTGVLLYSLGQRQGVRSSQSTLGAAKSTMEAAQAMGKMASTTARLSMIETGLVKQVEFQGSLLKSVATALNDLSASVMAMRENMTLSYGPRTARRGPDWVPPTTLPTIPVAQTDSLWGGDETKSSQHSQSDGNASVLRTNDGSQHL